MIRTILAAVIAVSIVLFVWQYATFTDRIKPPPVQIVEYEAGGKYDIRVVCTFDCEGNAFDLPAIKVGFRDRVLLERTELLAAGEAVLIENVPDIKQGLNDFHVQVTPVEKSGTAPGGAFSLEGQATGSKKGIARSVRVVVLRDGYEIADELIWSNQKGPFGELIRIEVDKPEHEH